MRNCSLYIKSILDYSNSIVQIIGNPHTISCYLWSCTLSLSLSLLTLQCWIDCGSYSSLSLHSMIPIARISLYTTAMASRTYLI